MKLLNIHQNESFQSFIVPDNECRGWIKILGIDESHLTIIDLPENYVELQYYIYYQDDGSVGYQFSKTGKDWKVNEKSSGGFGSMNELKNTIMLSTELVKSTFPNN